MEEGSYIEGVGCDKAVGWTGIWFDISGQEEKEGSTEDGAWLGSGVMMCQTEV